MVVTRRTSISPMPPASRTSSSTALPKLNKGKEPQSSALAHDEELPPANGEAQPTTPVKPDHTGPQFSDNVIFTDTPSPKKVQPTAPKTSPKQKSKVKGKRKEKHARKRSKSLVDLLAHMFLLGFLIYSCSVCPFDKELQSPVCRALSEYRRLVLDPLLVRPFWAALGHPSVSPYVDLVTPHFQTISNTVSPAVTRTKQEWDTRVVPLWTDRVAPQLDKYVSPQLAKVDAVLRPYRDRVSTQYVSYVAPYITHARKFSRRARPYVLLTAAKTYDSYQLAKPHVQSALDGLQRVPPLFFTYVAAPLGSARRQFVDPHVTTIFEKIKELSSGKPVSTNKDDQSSILDKDRTSASLKSDAAAETIIVSEPSTEAGEEIELPLAAEPTAEAASSPKSNAMSSSAYLGEEISDSVPGATYSPSPSDTQVDEVKIEGGVAPSPEPESELQVESTCEVSESVVKSSADATEADLKEGLEGASIEDLEISKEVVRNQEKGDTKSSSSDESEIESEAALASSLALSSTASASKDVEEDLKSFYADLGIDVDDLEKLDAAPGTAQLDEAPQPTRVEMSPEERAEIERQRTEKTAEKRKKLIERHTKWETELEDGVKEQRKALRKALVAIRKAAVAQLKSSDQIREEIEKLNAESEKALRGTEAFFKKLAKEGKGKEESIRVWDRVLGKVADKYSERVHSVESIVNHWYEIVYNEEIAEVRRAANVVKDIGERGQADLGLDYAWLDDVTVQDWNRYHALADKYPEFLDHAMTIQNGSHSSPPINPVATALSDLQSEVNDITLGFETRLRRIKRQGDRAFASDKAQEVEKLDVDDDVREVSETGESTEPVMSILPISDDEHSGDAEDEEVLQDVSNAILGRGKEDVIEALGRSEQSDTISDASGEEMRVAHEEL